MSLVTLVNACVGCIVKNTCCSVVWWSQNAAFGSSQTYACTNKLPFHSFPTNSKPPADKHIRRKCATFSNDQASSTAPCNQTFFVCEANLTNRKKYNFPRLGQNFPFWVAVYMVIDVGLLTRTILANNYKRATQTLSAPFLMQQGSYDSPEKNRDILHTSCF
jgi:hypothetical protein